LCFWGVFLFVSVLSFCCGFFLFFFFFVFVAAGRGGGGGVSGGWDANFVLLLIVCVDTEQFVVKIYGSIKID